MEGSLSLPCTGMLALQANRGLMNTCIITLYTVLFFLFTSHSPKNCSCWFSFSPAIALGFNNFWSLYTLLSVLQWVSSYQWNEASKGVLEIRAVTQSISKTFWITVFLSRQCYIRGFWNGLLRHWFSCQLGLTMFKNGKSDLTIFKNVFPNTVNILKADSLTGQPDFSCLSLMGLCVAEPLLRESTWQRVTVKAFRCSSKRFSWLLKPMLLT